MKMNGTVLVVFRDNDVLKALAVDGVAKEI
jgi:hypothetical protein